MRQKQKIRCSYPQGPRRIKRWAERVFKKIMAENSPNVVKDTNLQIQETEPIPERRNPKKLTSSRHNQTLEI